MLPTIKWEGELIKILDQRKLPSKKEWYTCRGYRDVINAIEKMVIRGAPAIGVAAAMGLALGASSIRTRSFPAFSTRFTLLAEKMRLARPTAVNLQWAVERMLRLVDRSAGRSVEEIKQALRNESEVILAQDIDINKNIGRHGLTVVPENSTILTHCNAGSLATAGYGTALGVIRAAHAARKNIRVFADETRPWLQGLRLTTFELMEDGIPVTVIADNAAGSLMRQGEIDLVITGADRIAANGDVANKIGTYQVALMARIHRIPFYVAAPLSTIDPATPDGEAIPVENRPPEEITRIGRAALAPPGVNALNPAFDITPAKYVTAIITEAGIILPPFKKNIKDTMRSRPRFSS
ncbi:MAG: S-methyl-5-thioribose-1-phosphate isomerase [Deltaproteobacteria bacterium]|nr:S-methyl-5-thioribose-1-phosphate isomerase [Deltaproteobacteria bacterium]